MDLSGFVLGVCWVCTGFVLTVFGGVLVRVGFVLGVCWMLC